MNNSGKSRRKPESMLDLAFQAIKELTDSDVEQWTLLELLKSHPIRLIDLSKIMRKDHGYSYDYISSTLGELVKKELAVRPRKGKYEPNYKPILIRMTEILETLSHGGGGLGA